MTVDHGSFLPSGLLPAPSQTVSVFVLDTQAWAFILPLGTRNLAALLKQTGRSGSNGLRALYDVGFSVRANFQTVLAAVTLVGTWTTSNRAESYGGKFSHSVTAGDTATWTSPQASTTLAVRGVLANNGGYVRVSIDGDPTAANKLTTAQAEVTAGRLAASVLVANGGTLQPTDRLYDAYQSSTNWDVRTVIADGLPNTTHTVTWEATGYTQGTAARSYISGFGYGANDATDLAFSSKVSSQSSVFERALSARPVGGGYQWVGAGHGNDVLVSLALSVDGSPVTPSVGDELVGTSIIATQVSEFRHPDVGGGLTKVADCTTTYTVDSQGILVEQSITWAVPVECQVGYLAMLPLDEPWDTCAFRRDGSLTVLADGDDGQYLGMVESSIAWMWRSDAADPLVVAWELFDVANTVNDWQDTGYKMFLQDRALDGSAALGLNKLYAPLVDTESDNSPVTLDGVNTSTVRYVFRDVADPTSLYGTTSTRIRAARTGHRLRPTSTTRRLRPVAVTL